MLSSLTIKNFAIIEEISLNFQAGMTVLSGETGAGKSIIIDALSLLLGGRGTPDYIRYGEEVLMIEGLFNFATEPEEIVALLTDFGIPIDWQEDGLTIQREINQQGKNVVRVNGRLANVSLLKSMGTYLGDIHGQNEHQLLLDSKQHLPLLDYYGQQTMHSLKEDYRVAYSHYQRLRTDWIQAHESESHSQQHLSFLEFQLDELNQVDFQEGEEVRLLAESKKLQHLQEMQSGLNLINGLLSENEVTVLNQLSEVSDQLQRIQAFDEEFPALLEKIDQTRFDLEDLARQLAFKANFDIDEVSTFDEIEQRLSVMSRFKRKYQLSIDELIAYQAQIRQEIDRLIHRDRYLDQLSEQLDQAYRAAYQAAERLHQARIQVSQDLKTQVEKELGDLYMTASQIQVDFQHVGIDKELSATLPPDQNRAALNANGYDLAEFYIVTNLGDTPKPLVKVASGGELSRFMLALKVVFAASLPSKVMVFDEIDTGVSGRVAFAIAQKMHHFSTYHQVLAITHLPQVAAISDFQFYITKSVDKAKTQTHVQLLTLSERYEVIARMMSGDTATTASLQLVKEMMTDLR